MDIKDIAIPEVYKESADFRFFCEWFQQALSKTQYDTDNLFDLYDPLKCPQELLWALADTMGFKYDDRLPTAYNRLVLLYFISMIKNKGSKDGVTLAAETNLAQFNILNYGQENEVLYNRLEDTSIPVNSAYVTSDTDNGYIDIVYFSTKKPTDACIEYVRPLGMFVFQHAGVGYNARTKLSVDARLTDDRDIGMSYGPTQVGHYSRADYASIQKDTTPLASRNPVYYRNSESEGTTDPDMNPGYRALCSLQLCNNEHIVKSLMDPIFDLGYGPQDISTVYPDNYLTPPYKDTPVYNLRYNLAKDTAIGTDIKTIDASRTTDILNPRPAVNPIMSTMGDAISMATDNSEYTDTVGTVLGTGIMVSFDNGDPNKNISIKCTADADIVRCGANLLNNANANMSNATYENDIWTLSLPGVHDHIIPAEAFEAKISTQYRIILNVVENTLSDNIYLSTAHAFYFGGDTQTDYFTIAPGVTGKLSVDVTAKRGYFVSGCRGSIWFRSNDILTGSFKVQVMITYPTYDGNYQEYTGYRHNTPRNTSIVVPELDGINNIMCAQQRRQGILTVSEINTVVE